MKLALVSVLSFCCFALVSVKLQADDKPAAKTYTGVIIDEHCADGKDQAGAEKHAKACALKCAKKDGGVLGLMVDGKYHKFDAAGTKLATEYLAKADSTTSAVVTATEAADGTLAVTAVAPVPPAPKI